MESISGIRGVVGESLTPEVVVSYSRAFAAWCGGGRVVIGRDGRATGKIIANLVSSTLLAAGCDVIALGVAPTPTIAIAVEQLHASGGISVTASHNPMEWNGLKFMGPSGMFLNAAENAGLRSLRNGAGGYAPWQQLGRHIADDTFVRQHIDMVLNLPALRPEAIRKRNFRVVADCINASGGIIVPHLLRELGCTVVELNCDGSGVFARAPEPVPEHLGELCARVRAERADLGIAVDPDADRLVFITEEGTPFGEENTIAAAVKFVLGREGGRRPVVVNLSTTRAVDDIARAAGAAVVRTPVGEINVAQKMKECGAVIGGEGSGGVILPAVHYGRDAAVGIGLILQELADRGGTIGGLKASMPAYAIAKTKVEFPSGVNGAATGEKLAALARRHAGRGRITADDGVKIDFPESWVHLRASNTEPIVRIIAEARTMEEAQSLAAAFQKELSA